ncbi:MAG TPA: hypothetical protein VLY20_02940 [Nitrospiria bacterium]|nr:hypothetical protein [Nitrospiria bacterium]HUK55594.1 hypothetical protein [Nitrospiria bacterium]
MKPAIGIIGLLSVLVSLTWPVSAATAAEAVSPPVSKTETSNNVYTLRAKNHWMANKTIKDLVELLGGTSKSNLLKGSRPQTIRIELSLPRDQSAYFMSKLSGLGMLTSPSGAETKSPNSKDSLTSRMTLDVFDP